jgi:hypothetical protein
MNIYDIRDIMNNIVNLIMTDLNYIHQNIFIETLFFKRCSSLCRQSTTVSRSHHNIGWTTDSVNE